MQINKKEDNVEDVRTKPTHDDSEKKQFKKKKKNTEVQTFQESYTEVWMQGAGYVQFRISTRKIIK